MPNSAYGVGTYGVATYGGSTNTPPVISNIAVVQVAATYAQITWSTNVQADTHVLYGLAAPYSNTTALDATPVLNHSVLLVALQPNTTYHFAVVSTAVGTGQTTTSSDHTFSTLAPSANAITNFQTLSIGPQQVTVGWQTTQLSDGQVVYGLTTAYGQQTTTDPAPVLSHQVTVTGLLPNTTYHLQANSSDPSGVDVFSPDLTITTPRPAGRLYTWIEPNGTAHVFDPMSDPSFRVVQGAKGYGTPPTNWLEDRVPQHDGAITRDVLYDTREIEVPLLIQASDYPTLLSKTRLLRQWTNVKSGDGTLQIAEPDGTTRQFTCRLKQGLEGQEGQDVSGPTWRKVLLVFRTTSSTPYANWPSALNFTYQQAAASATWFPIFPLVLGGAGIFAQPTLLNPGDVEAEPIWTLTGPMTNPVLTNVTTGAKISLTLALLTGQTLTIDTRFRIKSVIRNDGTKLFSALSNDSSLWTLAPGVNALTVVASSTSAASQLQLSFTPRTL